VIAQTLPQKDYSLNNIKPLTAYILRVAHAHPDPERWGLSHDRQTEAVVWAKAINCAGPHLGRAVKEMDMTQRMNRRAVTNRSYHYVVSFPAGEFPSRAVLENIEEVLSTAVGYGAHQRLFAVHGDTAHLHMHVVINRVHPVTFRYIGTHLDHLALQRTSAELEDIHGLIRDNHVPGSRIRDREVFRPSRQPPPRPRDPVLQAAYKLAREQAVDARKRALQALRAQHQRYFEKLVAWHAQRRANAKTQRLSRADRQSTYVYLRDAACADHDQRKQQEKQEREAVKQQFAIPTWDTFMAQQPRQIEPPDHTRDIADRARHGPGLDRFR
jgi:Relaxase/Mobilisation nuclease domain